jgi:hypothetical protein
MSVFSPDTDFHDITEIQKTNQSSAFDYILVSDYSFSMKFCLPSCFSQSQQQSPTGAAGGDLFLETGYALPLPSNVLHQ